MPQATVHLLRHGEVHNPDARPVRQAAGIPPLRTRPADGGHARGTLQRPRRAGSQARAPRSVPADPGPGDGGADRRGAEPQDRHRSAHHRGRQLLRGPEGHQGRTPAAQALGRSCATRSGRPGASPTRSRPPASWRRSRTRAAPPSNCGGDGAEAIMVSHQLPIWATRLSAEGKPLWHDPRKRECTLTSLTSLVFDDDGNLVRVQLQRACCRAAPRCRQHPGGLSMARNNPGGPAPSRRSSPGRRRPGPGRWSWACPPAPRKTPSPSRPRPGTTRTTLPATGR